MKREYLTYAAINIGSNAIRLYISYVFDTINGPIYKKANLIRLPVRLGEDTFNNGEISNEKIELLITALKGYKQIIDVYQPKKTRACATSAMREANNCHSVVKRVLDETGINIEVISGEEEADIIFSTHIEKKLEQKNAYLYVDIGGGSTEVSLFANNKLVDSKSFKIGTIRMMYKQIEKAYWKSFKNWIQEATTGYDSIIAIGSGGNIGRFNKMAKPNGNKYLSTKNIVALTEELRSYQFEERMKVFGLKPDRADVILPFSKIYLAIMNKAKIKQTIVPQTGLSEGMVVLMHEENKELLAE